MGSSSKAAKDRARAPRSDALRNRRQVLQAAAEAFAADGLDASVNDIARAAAVGVGTLYRHFPSKEHLLAEVLRERLSALREVVRELPVGDEPGDVLAHWTRVVSSHIADFTLVGGWVQRAFDVDPELNAVHQQILVEGAALLRAAQRAGRASCSVTIDDLLAAIVALNTRAPDDPERPQRLLALLIDGLLRTPQ